MKEDTLESFLLARNAALTELNVAWAKTWLPGIPDEVAVIALHKARYECKAISEQLRRDSRSWLEERGFGRTGGLPWPSSEELPE